MSTSTMPVRNDEHAVAPASQHPGRGTLHRIVLGRSGDPRWARPALFALLAATAVLYLWDLGSSGWANSFYTAAVQAGTESWKAFFFGSFDSSNFITVDKPPAALWVMELSARVFGVNSWSVLVPQALMGVASVGVLYATVRRGFGATAGLLAGAVLALTPVATLMFRFNNPDAMLVLLLVLSVYAFTRAQESASTRWLVAAAAFIGTGFITKMLQAFLIVPVLALVYLVTAPTPVRRRIAQLVAAGAALVVASSWWVAVVALTPANDRPYVGGSQDNSILNLVFGYNGFGRLTGNESGSVGGGPTGTSGRWGATGITRMFNSEFGGQISWLIPAALITLVATLWLSRRAGRTNPQRSQAVVWGGWLVVTGLVFSLAAGIIHPYYSVALAPAIGALIGINAASLWRHRHRWIARVALALSLAVTACWAWMLLDRSPTWHPWLRMAILVVGFAASAAILALPWFARRAVPAVAIAAIVVGLAGPAAYAIETASVPHTGSLPTAGPAVSGANGFGGPGGPRAGGFPGGGFPRGGFAGGPQPGGAQLGGTQRGRAFGGAGAPGGGRGMGGLLDAQKPSAAIVAALQQNAGSYQWVAATIGANNAAGYQLGAGEPVMAIGGFNGTDPTPTLAQFQSLVRAGTIHYFIAGGMGGGGFGGFGGGSGSSVASQISQWVQQNYTATTIGGTTVYDLTAGASQG